MFLQLFFLLLACCIDSYIYVGHSVKKSIYLFWGRGFLPFGFETGRGEDTERL